MVPTFTLRHSNQYLDRFNPFVSEETSYVRIEDGARQVVDAQAVTAEGEPLGYPLSFTAFGGEGGIISIDHKGTYVLEIATHPDIPQPAVKALEN